jgi:hypothetical protein
MLGLIAKNKIPGTAKVHLCPKKGWQSLFWLKIISQNQSEISSTG